MLRLPFRITVDVDEPTFTAKLAEIKDTADFVELEWGNGYLRMLADRNHNANSLLRSRRASYSELMATYRSKQGHIRVSGHVILMQFMLYNSLIGVGFVAAAAGGGFGFTGLVLALGLAAFLVLVLFLQVRSDKKHLVQKFQEYYGSEHVIAGGV